MRKNIIKKMIKGVACSALALSVAFTGIPGVGNIETATKAEAATAVSQVPIVTYTRYASSKTTTYTTSALSKSTGYICYYDQCTILAVYPNQNSVKVRYPVTGGMRTAYASMSAFFYKTNFTNATRTIGSSKTAYRKSTGNATIGSVYSTDQVVIIGSENNRTEVLYPASSGYKLGWISGVYSTASSGSASVSKAISSSQAKAVMFNANYYANAYSDLKAAFGYDSTKLYNHYLTYGIKEGRSASPIFDPVYYLNNNADLKRAYGSNYTSAYNHWINYGCSEGRASSKYYNGSYYKNRYSDLRNAYFSSGSAANSYYNLALHYLTYGINEKRWANSSGYIPSGISQSGGSSSNSAGWDSRVGKTVANINSKYYTTDNISYVAGYKGQCTWYAYGRFYEVTGIKLGKARHAKYWLSDNASNSRVTVTYGASTIKSKSIAVRTSGNYGHVMFVENVTYSNGSPQYVYFTECNADGNGIYNAGSDCIVKRLSYSSFISQKNPAGYISAR